MAWQRDFGPQLPCASNGLFEVGHFKPQEHTVSSWEVGIADGSMIMLDVPAVQLKNQRAFRYEALIMWPAMITLTAEQTLIPATARFNVCHANKRLWTHIDCHRFYLWTFRCRGGSDGGIHEREQVIGKRTLRCVYHPFIKV